MGYMVHSESCQQGYHRNYDKDDVSITVADIYGGKEKIDRNNSQHPDRHFVFEQEGQFEGSHGELEGDVFEGTKILHFVHLIIITFISSLPVLIGIVF